MYIMNNTNTIHNKNISVIQKYQLDQIINAKQMLSRLVADMKYIYVRVGGIWGMWHYYSVIYTSKTFGISNEMLNNNIVDLI